MLLCCYYSYYAMFTDRWFYIYSHKNILDSKSGFVVKMPTTVTIHKDWNDILRLYLTGQPLTWNGMRDSYMSSTNRGPQRGHSPSVGHTLYQLSYHGTPNMNIYQSVSSYATVSVISWIILNSIEVWWDLLWSTESKAKLKQNCRLVCGEEAPLNCYEPARVFGAKPDLRSARVRRRTTNDPAVMLVYTTTIAVENLSDPTRSHMLTHKVV